MFNAGWAKYGLNYTSSADTVLGSTGLLDANSIVVWDSPFFTLFPRMH